jgi:kinesin family protein 2/24
LGGTLVFCDLAGNEYARDAAGSTKEEMEESAAINKSLLAVKEMIRSLNISKNNDNTNNNSKNNSKMHVAHRDSKLSIMLHRHVQEGNGSRAVMMGHISPSQEYVRKTINTLTYCSMVGTTGAAAIDSKKTIRSEVLSTTGKGKENTP